MLLEICMIKTVILRFLPRGKKRNILNTPDTVWRVCFSVELYGFLPYGKKPYLTHQFFLRTSDGTQLFIFPVPRKN